MAIEEEAAIVFSGKLTRNGLLPWAGAETKIPEGPEGVDRRGGAPLEAAARREAGLLHGSIAESTALREGAGLEVAGGGAVRAISPVEPSRPGMVAE